MGLFFNKKFYKIIRSTHCKNGEFIVIIENQLIFFFYEREMITGLIKKGGKDGGQGRSGTRTRKEM